MKAVILAAGEGRRLASYTDCRPKAMIDFAGKPLIRYAIDNFRNASIDDITIITGYKAGMFGFSGVNYLHNKKYAETNMVYTLFCAESIMDDDLIVSYADIIFEQRILQKLLQDKNDIAVVVDDKWQELWKLKSDNPLDDAETLKLDKQDYIREIGARPEDFNQIDSQYIGLLKFSKNGIDILKNVYRGLKEYEQDEIIIRGRTLNQLYMTDMLQLIINKGNRIKGIRINGGWLEVDTREEYERFLAMHKEGSLVNLCDTTGI